MKRILCLLLITVLVSTMCSCNNSDSNGNGDDKELAITISKIMGGLVEVGRAFGYKTDEDLVNKRMEQLCNAIEKRDKASIKDMFSRKAQEDCTNIDEQLDTFFEFIEGEVVSWELVITPSVHAERSDGKNVKSSNSRFFLKTSEDIYSIFLEDFHVNEIEPEKKGLYNIGVAQGKIEKWWGTAEPGIHMAEFE